MKTRLLFGLILLATMASTCNQELPVGIPGLSQPDVSDEEQLTRLLNDVHEGMEKRRIYKVLAHVSTSYQDAEGRDYEAIQEYLSALFKNYRAIRITRGRPIITVQGNQASAVETFGTQAEPFAKSAYRPVNLQGRVTVSLERVGQTWKITEWSTLQ